MGMLLSLHHVVGDTCQDSGSTTTSTPTQVADRQKSSGLFSSMCLNSHQLGAGCMGGHLLSTLWLLCNPASVAWWSAYINLVMCLPRGRGCCGHRDFTSFAACLPDDFLSKYLKRVHNVTGGVQCHGLSEASFFSVPRIHGPCAMRKERVLWDQSWGQGYQDCVK